MSVRVGDAMVATKEECVRAEESVLAVARQLADCDVESAAICDADGRIIGAMGCRDVVEVLARGWDPAAITCGYVSARLAPSGRQREFR